jgi:DNA-directed RNA polymerase beta subunit
MIQFKALKPFTHVVNGIRFPQIQKNPFLIVYFSENSTFVDDYSKLNLLRVDAKKVIIPKTKIPFSSMTPEIKNTYKAHGLVASSSIQAIPQGQNLIYDLSPFLQSMEESYKMKNYRARGGFLLKNIVDKIFSSFPNSYEKVFIYSVDATKNVPKYIDRKMFPFILEIKKNNLYYDHLIMNTISDSSSRYRLLIKNRDVKFNKVNLYLKNIKVIDGEEEVDGKVETASNIIIKKIEGDIDPSNKSKFKQSIQKFFEKNPKSLDKTHNNELTNNDAKDIAIASALYRSTGDMIKARQTAVSIPDSKKTMGLKVIDKKYVDELLEPKKTESTSEDIVIQLSNVAKAVGNKSPEHIFEKRKIDFETNLKKDIVNSFKVLETKGVPLTFKSVKVVKKHIRPGDLSPSDISTIHVVVVDKFKREHEILLDVPNVSNDGTFKINGKKKCLINQLVLCPITFPKLYDSKFESSYSTFHIWSKRTKREEYLEAYIGSYKVPILVLLGFSFGFKESCQLYDIRYKITDQRPDKETKWSVKVDDKQWILFENINTKLKEEIVQSLIHVDISSLKINGEFLSHEYFNNLIIKMSGRINSTFLIQSNLENIVDPVAKQVLINQQLPSELHLIMKYMSTKVVEGFTQKRNDVSNQRIRNSEVIVHLAQKQILAAHTEYKEQVLSGNKKAIFDISQTKVLSDFINSEIVADMEYANPIEEMATKTRVSPVGKAVGGIPDKQAIQNAGRNVHDSMFGNIDTLDTPEGENVGIVQQLTVDAFITSARGIIQSKEKKEGENSGMLSTTAAQIPFVENDDGNRVMFGCSQMRQAVPLRNPEQPMIQSGYESILTSVLSDDFIKKSPCNGKVTKVTDDAIYIQCSTGGNKVIPVTPVHLRSGSGKDTLSVFKPTVKAGSVVKEKSIIAEGSCVSGGAIALGRSMCVALMPYKGFNFEDGIVLSERIVREGVLNSLHGIVEEVEIGKEDRVVFINELGKDTIKGEPLLRKSIGEIEQLIGFDEDEEGTEIVSGHLIKKSPGGKIVDIEVFNNLKEGKFPELDKLSKRTRTRYGLKDNEKFSHKGDTIPGVMIRFKLEQELPVGVGDKLTNRHGAKGIVSLIEKDELMPRTPTGDQVDIILNPIGVVGRMNIGQLYELYTGLISKELGRQIIKLNDKPKVIALLHKVLPNLDMTKNKEFSTNLINKFKALNDVRFKTFMKQVKDSGSMTILIPPFKAPAYKEIIACLKSLGLKSGYNLSLPEFNTKTKSKVPIGYMYILKLEHIAKDKLHARSTGPMTSKTFQPTAGKKREGGQRMGELDTYSFISYNCPNLLAEFFGPLSDDIQTKNEILSDIIQTGSAKYRNPKASPVRDLLNSYFISLMIWR